MNYPVLWEGTLPGGWNWSQPLRPGTALELTDLEGGACAALIAYNPAETSERYNMPDTAKIQFVAQVGKGHALYSDMGRILLTILADDFGGHDIFGGTLDQADLEKRFGAKSYQEFRNAYHRSGRLALMTELAKYGLDHRDLVPNVNFFCRTVVGDEGALSFGPRAAAGSKVVLQAEMPVLIVLAATQHRLDPRTEWAPKPLGLRILSTGVKVEDNPAWDWESNRRGFANTLQYQIERSFR